MAKKSIGIFITILIILFYCARNKSINNKEIIAFADELYLMPEIVELNDCMRSSKIINGSMVYLNKNNPPSKSSYKKTEYYQTILERDHITESDFNYVRQKLQETGLIGYIYKKPYSIFITGGAMGDIYGYIVTHGVDTIPIDGVRINKHYYIWPGKKLENRLYKFSGS